MKQAPSDGRLARQLDLNLLRMFHEIARAGSIGAAAKRLNMQQPSVSLALKRLEAHIGTELCLRTTRGVELTPAGRVVATMAEDMLRAVNALPAGVAAAKGDVEGVLTIRAVSGVVSADLDDALGAMRRRHPRVLLRIDIAPKRIVLDALVRDQAELCISFDSAPRADLRYEALVREQQQVYCGRKHPLFGHACVDPAELASERFVLTGSDEPEEVRRFRQRFRLGEHLAGQAEQLDEAKRLIRTGAGIGFLPTAIMANADDRSRFWPLLRREVLPSYLLYLISKMERDLTPPTLLFLREIRRLLAARGAPV